LKVIILGAVIGSIEIRAGTVQADADRIQPIFDNQANPLRPASVGVEINGPHTGLFSNLFDALGNQLELGQGLTLASLPETDNGLRALCEVFRGQLNDFILGRPEIDSVMGRRAGELVFQGEAAEAVGIALPADGQGGLPSPEEQVFCGKAMVMGRAIDEVFDKGAGGPAFLIRVNSWNQFPVIVISGIPSVIIFDTESGSPVSIISKAYSGIGPCGESVVFGPVIHRR